MRDWQTGRSWPLRCPVPGFWERYARVMAVLGAQAASTFESLRPHLMSVAYRLTGTVADVEDIVQEAWLRWDAAPGRDDVADLRAWLTTVVSRLGLDKLRSAARRRETYTGHWLPEPVVTGLGDARGGLIRCRRWSPPRMPALRSWWCWSGSARISGSRSCCTTGSPCRSPRWPG